MDYFWHEHKIYERPIHPYEDCSVCYFQDPKSDEDSKSEDSTHHNMQYVYVCKEFQITWHTSCVPSSPENINHPCHPNHPLEFLAQRPPYADEKCSLLCRGELTTNFIYHCKLFDFSVDSYCVMKPPPLTVDQPKCHQHALTLMGRDVSFTCNACGTHGEQNPLFFGIRYGEICRQDINWRYGAYSCNKCPTFFVHSKCATHEDVWDGVELQGIPEEEASSPPFNVIDEGVINHFSHEEHNLLLIEDVIIDGGGEDIHCEGCSRPISFERFYNCMECDFKLHEECASQSLQKRHALSTRIFSLSTGKQNDDTCFRCTACDRVATGFRYSDGDGTVLDVHCASLSWFRHQKLHPHTLFLTTLGAGECIGCDYSGTPVLRCMECGYSLGFKCATLPVVIKHRCDDHYLFLSSGEKTTGKNWCEICEGKRNPHKWFTWFYTCHDCGVVCHIDCVIGDSLNVKLGLLSMDKEGKLEAVLNNHNSRPLCSSCATRCMGPVVYKTSRYHSGEQYYFCTLNCVSKDLSICSSLKNE